MKKITLALILLTFGAQAQSFPSPYCDLEDTSVEEITSVVFGGTTITNTNGTAILIDKTASVVSLTQGETYTITVEGFTSGNFENDITAFIDWNQNATLDDTGEVYAVGTIVNSTGSDGVSVSLDITVPADALTGTTRIRITKVYGDEDSPAEVNPCAIEMDVFGMGAFPGYGQALDFTLDIQAASTNPFPSPYCDLEDTSVEEITSVVFGGTTITNSNDTDILIDKTANVVNVTPGQTYTITVEGFTSGNFENDITAFIDWNQNATLDDTGEVYAVGTIVNSTGSDGVSVSLDITVPADALTGTTRIRITKVYGDEDSPAEVNPCAIEMDVFGMGAFPGYGQALDFTLNVGTMTVNTFDTQALSVYPVPAKDILNINYKSAISGVKIYNLLGQEVYAQNTAESALQLDLSTLSAGTYILKLFSEDMQHNMRIIKQ